MDTIEKTPRTVELPEQRYRDDAAFHSLVDMLEGMLHAAHFTPTDLRDAAVMAATHHAWRTVPDFVYVGGALAPRLRGEPIDPHPPVVIVGGVQYRRS